MGPDEVKDINAAWETESGLIDDVDGWIANPIFGIKEEYATAVALSGTPGGVMIMFDLVDEDGIVIGNQGYSIGTGWEVSDDGRYITHPKRKNVVSSTVYGQLQIEVIKNLEVDMGNYGDPTDAMSWNGLGFHWNQKSHATVSGDTKQGLMPTLFLGKKEGSEAAIPVAKSAAKKAAAPAAKANTAKIEALKLVGSSSNAKEFMMKAIKVPAIVNDDELMAQCTDDSETGFFAQNTA